MKNIKYLLSIGLLLCAAISAQQQFAAGSNAGFDRNKVKGDKTRKINDKTKVEAAPKTVTGEVQGASDCKLCRGFAKTDYRYNALTYEKYPAHQAVAAQPAGTLTGDRTIRGMSRFVQRKYKTNPYYGFSDTRPWILTNRPRFRLCTTPVISVQAFNSMYGIC
jgi:hypothetical protein